ncbi:DUF202 domain-containing protein [Kribbella sp. NPDC000426]|uniref:DUF202 domain-containing protein n=1 Tax=Kribbella sp. NPDC000426 TaxID=3154255 RepID=UPI00332F2342
MTHQPLFDAGLQPERTELAWRRTALSIATASLVSVRVLPEMLGSLLWALFGIAGVVLAICVWTAARSRYLHFNTTANDGSLAGLAAGKQLFAVTLFASTAGLLATAAVLHAA